MPRKQNGESRLSSTTGYNNTPNEVLSETKKEPGL